MNPYDFAPIRALLSGAYWTITHLTDLLLPLAGAASAAAAIVALTLALRALLIPVGVSQAKAQRTRTRLAPHIADLNKKYRHNPQLLREKTMELYAQQGANPAAGCAPALVQLPLLMAVYGLFIQPSIAGQPNELLGYSLAGVPLGTGLGGQVLSGGLSPAAVIVFGVLMLVIAAVAYLSRKFLPVPPVAGGGGPAQMAGMANVLSFLPYATVLVAAVVPLAAGIYLATTTAWTLGERLILTRCYPLD